ncbi:MAG: hypothetical protein CMH78_04455 [Nitrospinae bacterium]|nr:hypothetical protein [Nitrospinota bacterium]
MQTWRLIRDKNHDGLTNMAKDEAISIACGEGKSPATLRFYGWKPPAVSIGYSQKAESDINLQYCNSVGIDIVKRPTGGRAVLHENELTFSFNVSIENPLFPKNILNSHKKISEALLLGLHAVGVNAQLQYKSKKEIHRNPFCFSASSLYELVFAGKKIVGCAQRRFRNSFLEHGSIPLKLDRRKLSSIFMHRNFDVTPPLVPLRGGGKGDVPPKAQIQKSVKTDMNGSFRNFEKVSQECSNLRNNLSFSEKRIESLYFENMAGLNELGSYSFSFDQLIQNFLKGFERHFEVNFKEGALSHYEIGLMRKIRTRMS